MVTGMPLLIVQVSGLWQYKTPHHAAGRPRDDPDAGAVDRGAGREGVQKAHVAGGERRPDIGFRNVLAEIDAELERALRLERRLRDGLDHQA